MCKIYRKQAAFFAIFMALTFSVFSQSMSSGMMSDSSKVFNGSKGFKKFSIGVNAGFSLPAVITGGSNDYLKPKAALLYGANLKYQFTHWFALQADYLRGTVQGNNDRNKHGRTSTFTPTPRSFKTDLNYAASLNGVFTLGNVNWLRVKNFIVPYLTAGAGIASYNVKVGTTNGDPTITYTANNPIHETFVKAGGGIKLNLSPSLNLDLGYLAHYIDGDNFDGYAYYRTANPGRQLHRDKFSYLFAGLEFALGGKGKPQLMFDNPAARMNSDLQNQINVLRSQLNLADTDGDGVADIFDKEPNTPAGCPVDSHGVTKDTDGDGVPDCRDKELITPTYCQPVDANGVGKCPPPECCNNMVKQTPNQTMPTSCTVGDLPSLSFKGNAATLSADVKSILATVASKLKDSPNCNVEITGYPATSKASQAVCNKRTEAIKMYLTSQAGISADRLSTNCSMSGGDANTIDLKVK